jgi:hypothetical protein
MRTVLLWQVKDVSAFEENGAFFAKSVEDGAVFDLQEMGLGYVQLSCNK